MSINVNKEVNNILINFIENNFNPIENINPKLDFSIFNNFNEDKI
jgi:hypothetical protein